MIELPDADWYLDNVLIHASPGSDEVRRGPATEWTTWWTERSEGELVQAGIGFVLSYPELLGQGITRQRARTRIGRREWVDAGYGFVAPIDISTARMHLAAQRVHALRSAAAARRRVGHLVSARSAAILCGLPTFRVPTRPELTAPIPCSLGRKRGRSHIYGAGLQAEDRASWFGIPVTSVARTLVDLARHDRWDGIMAADAALREKLVSQRDLDRALAAAVGWPGIRQARQLLALATPQAESPLESLTRLRLHDDGFPVPELQVWIGRDRVDMLFPAQRLILEIDGLEKYTDDALRREKRREIRLRRQGYRVERVTWEDVVKRWPETSAWLRTILRLPASAG